MPVSFLFHHVSVFSRSKWFYNAYRKEKMWKRPYQKKISASPAVRKISCRSINKTHCVFILWPCLFPWWFPEIILNDNIWGTCSRSSCISQLQGEKKNHPWTFTAYASKLNRQCAVGAKTSFPRISDESVQFDQPLLHCTQAFSNESIQGLNTFHIFVVKYCLIMLQWRTVGCFTSS